ncbi:MAG: ABC transporter ATP-binding protein [Halanaerobiales bacterium]|nr:ABC transporter ATP-binding protein [Halanaerobiales bacterium]
MFLELKNLDFYYNKKKKYILNNFTLSMKNRKTLSILGESGSGKSTILRLIAGLEKPSSGKIFIDQQIMNGGNTFIPPENRKVGMVFQDYALFPHMTVYENINFGINDLSKDIRKNKITKILKLVELQEFKDKYPHQLSGGQQQRTALARAIVIEPKILLLDEPFSNLDTNLKHNIRKKLNNIISKINITTIIVSHDKHDALTLADELIILKDGEIVQKGKPQNVISIPKTKYIKGIVN